MAAPVPPPSGETALYLVVGLLTVTQIAGLIAAFVRWLGARTVENEDKEKRDLRDRLDKHEARFEELEDAINGLEKTLTSVQTELKQTHELVGSVRGAVAEIKATLETRFEKQADFYRSALKDHAAGVTDSLEKMEFQLRQDTTRAIHDAQTFTSRRKGK